MENKNPSGSIKDRVVEYILNKMKKDLKIKIGSELLVIATNDFAVSFSNFCSKKGYKAHIITNESINENHKKICNLYGATFYEFNNIDYKNLLIKKEEIIKSKKEIIYVDLYDKNLSLEAYGFSFCNEFKHQIKIHGKNLKRVFLFDDSDFLAETLYKEFSGVEFYNVKIKNSIFTFNKIKKDVIKNLNLFPEFDKDKKIYKKEICFDLKKVVENIEKVASSSGLIMDYKTSASYLAAKEYPCFNNDINLIVFYENGERYLEQMFFIKK